MQRYRPSACPTLQLLLANSISTHLEQRGGAGHVWVGGSQYSTRDAPVQARSTPAQSNLRLTDAPLCGQKQSGHLLAKQAKPVCTLGARRWVVDPDLYSLSPPTAGLTSANR